VHEKVSGELAHVPLRGIREADTLAIKFSSQSGKIALENRIGNMAVTATAEIFGRYLSIIIIQ